MAKISDYFKDDSPCETPQHLINLLTDDDNKFVPPHNNAFIEGIKYYSININFDTRKYYRKKQILLISYFLVWV